jgi:triacylglycerol lipase
MSALATMLVLLATAALLLVPESAPSMPARTGNNQDCVVLLHGLGRTSLSMKGVEWYLKRRGYRVINARYPTSGVSIGQISQQYLAPLLESEAQRSAAKINFVTHSQGGILLRQYLSDHNLPNLGRVVMLAPPNHGSEVIDRLKANRLTRPFLGPGYLELGTDANALPKRLGPVNFDCGIIAGDFSLNPFLSGMLTGPNDGKVTTASAQISGMRDFLVVPYSHTWLMWRKTTLRQIQCFLETGKFERITV